MNNKKNKMPNAKCQKGITLIALIITVIVLLILAGTAISIAINGGDIFGKASQAREGWNSAVATEEQKINEVWNILNTMTGGNNGGGANPTPNPTAGWDMNKVASTVTGTITVDGNTNVPVTAPIPTGYTASDVAGENTIAGGLVIYQGTDQVSTDEDAITTRNQFVWIPVANINSMIMCKSNASGSICDIELANGELHCKTHDTTGAENMCGRLYGVDVAQTSGQGAAPSASNPYIYETSMDFTLNTQTFTDNSGYREPDLVTDYDKDANATYFATAGMASGSQTAAAFKTQLQNDFYAMAKSVALYKGFYIARYEAGYESTTYTSKKGQTVMNASATANPGANKWYGLYNHLRTTMGTLNSQMIWGCQYDQAIKFIKQNMGTNDLDPKIGHTNLGRRTDNQKDVSGAVALDIMKNIYDLEGNCFEWTAQAYNTNIRVIRGCNYIVVSNSVFYPASYRLSYAPSNTDDGNSSRSGLYL